MTQQPLARLVAAARQAPAAADPVAALRRLQEEVAVRREDVLAWLPGAGEEETVLHAEPGLTLLRVEIGPRTAFPPHDHLIPACVAVLRGREVNTFYRADGATVTETGQVETRAGGVLPMDEHVVHSVSNHGDERSVALHVYLGDLFGISRSIWDVAAGTRHDYRDERYFALARTVQPA